LALVFPDPDHYAIYGACYQINPLWRSLPSPSPAIIACHLYSPVIALTCGGGEYIPTLISSDGHDQPETNAAVAASKPTRLGKRPTLGQRNTELQENLDTANHLLTLSTEAYTTLESQIQQADDALTLLMNANTTLSSKIESLEESVRENEVTAAVLDWQKTRHKDLENQVAQLHEALAHAEKKTSATRDTNLSLEDEVKSHKRSLLLADEEHMDWIATQACIIQSVQDLLANARSRLNDPGLASQPGPASPTSPEDLVLQTISTSDDLPYPHDPLQPHDHPYVEAPDRSVAWRTDTAGKRINLREAMDLVNDSVYLRMRAATRNLVLSESSVDWYCRWVLVDRFAIARVAAELRVQFPYLRRYINDFPAFEWIHSYTANGRRFRARHAAAVRVAAMMSAAPAAPEHGAVDEDEELV